MEIARFEFLLKVENSFSLPEFKGSTFRGKFGHVLKRVICLQSHRDCQRCSLRSNCAYVFLFESQSERNQEVPRPFIVEPPLTTRRFIPRDNTLYLRLVLMGKAIDYLPYFVYVFQKMGQEGVGTDKGYYRLTGVRALDAGGKRYEIYQPEEERLSSEFPRIQLEEIRNRIIPQLTLEFLTPTRIFVRKRMVQQLTFSTLMRAIVRRYRSLSYFHGNGIQERFPIDWDVAEKVEIVQDNLQFTRVRRYSSRQRAELSVSGFTGKITYRGNLSPFWLWIKIGEYLHVGKGTVFGLGWYRVVGL